MHTELSVFKRPFSVAQSKIIEIIILTIAVQAYAMWSMLNVFSEPLGCYFSFYLFLFIAKI